MPTNVAHVNRDNTIEWILESDCVPAGATQYSGSKPADLSPVTRMQLVNASDGSVLVDSDVEAGVFDWTQGNGRLVITLGSVVSAGTYDVDLIVIDPQHSAGLVWAKSERVKVL